MLSEFILLYFIDRTISFNIFYIYAYFLVVVVVDHSKYIHLNEQKKSNTTSKYKKIWKII
jgi:hypothetical protein